MAGARATGMESEIGTLTPSKESSCCGQAASTFYPINDPIGVVVRGSVFIAETARKRRATIGLGVRDYVVEKSGFELPAT
jgi:hypothetical protein